MRTHRWHVALSWGVWWAALTAAFWLLGRAVDQPAGPAGGAATAVLAIAVGETGDRLRRRRAARRRGTRV
ncbi:hypothetical protein V1L54_18295 [Streptomyces sp. TRM 70361]|uniref:hypothetical protein n=1 Tax=Streptomyces sp. TRM 70361 TaxID=3116553 RepID=UPI002E7B21F9|nr:hypothetical protein [Streptomyces sp. TRM 70361]MEE1941334.1 hypothetical protein [Streptomyces sp. TRM 70361]